MIRTIRRNPQCRCQGFTLVEIMIVVVIIGLLAALGAQSYLKLKNRSAISRAANDLRVFAEGFERYALEVGVWPADGVPSSIPAGMSGYISAARWQAGTSLGGEFDWDMGVFGVTAAISLYAPTVPSATLVSLDELLDDGDLATGRLRSRANGILFVLEN